MNIFIRLAIYSILLAGFASLQGCLIDRDHPHHDRDQHDAWHDHHDDRHDHDHDDGHHNDGSDHDYR